MGFFAARVAPLWAIRSGGATTSTRSRDAYVKLFRGFPLLVIWPIVVASPLVESGRIRNLMQGRAGKGLRAVLK